MCRGLLPQMISLTQMASQSRCSISPGSVMFRARYDPVISRLT
jgi:hypothetical protein